MGSAKDPHRFHGQPSSLWPSCTLWSGQGSALGASKADIALSKRMLRLLGRPHLAFGQALHSLHWGEASPRMKHDCRAAATQVQIPEGGAHVLACSRQPSYSRSRSSQRPRRRGEA
jgi:hypothetical protein